MKKTKVFYDSGRHNANNNDTGIIQQSRSNGGDLETFRRDDGGDGGNFREAGHFRD